jgi:polyhydroxyalkanoate synthesis regulator protein
MILRRAFYEKLIKEVEENGNTIKEMLAQLIRFYGDFLVQVARHRC